MSLARPRRSVRANNPGNLERNSIEWLGLASLTEMTAEQRAEQRFCVFRSPVFGFRALALDLFTSWRKGRTTIRALITRFAPSNENDTAAYVNAVSDGMGIAPDVPLNLDEDAQLTALCRAVATHESGGWDGLWNAADLAEGVRGARAKAAMRLVA